MIQPRPQMQSPKKRRSGSRQESRPQLPTSPTGIHGPHAATAAALPARWPARRIIGELSKTDRALVAQDLQSEA